MRNLVSILIPAYNSARWLRDSVSSALAQTWARKEVIIVDDGSKDNTLALARTFESPIVKVVAQQNMGAPDARNTALSYAQGDYIQWLDADDVLHPQKIEAQLKGADDGQRSLTLLTSSWGKFFFRTSAASFRPDALWQDHTPVGWIVTRFTEKAWMNPAVWLVSRRLTDLTGPWDSRLAKSGDDDGEYICRVAAASDRVKFVEEARCYYRIGTVGSLNWNMEARAAVLKSLLLSLHLATKNSDSEGRLGKDPSCGPIASADVLGIFLRMRRQVFRAPQWNGTRLGGGAGAAQPRLEVLPNSAHVWGQIRTEPNAKLACQQAQSAK